MVTHLLFPTLLTVSRTDKLHYLDATYQASMTTKDAQSKQVRIWILVASAYNNISGCLQYNFAEG